MRLLFVHQNFPGQYKHLAPYFAAKSVNEVIGIGEAGAIARNLANARSLRGIGYPAQPPAHPRTHPFLRDLDRAVRRGQEVYKLAKKLKADGFVPDVICCHPGWGEALFLKDVFPNSPLLGLLEFYYQFAGADVGFDPEFPAREEDPGRIRLKNTVILQSLGLCDWGVCPTRWQLEQFPQSYRERISVIFDGVDTGSVRPNPGVGMRIQSKDIQLDRRAEVITFVNRNLEPYRGFHIFMRCLPRLLRERPNAHVIIVGGDEISYGQSPKTGGTWRKVMLAELQGQIDLNRVHFVGRIPYPRFIQLLQLSSVHVYLTYPFVLSWSMIEAMSAGCLVVGSATSPVQEVIEDGVNGLLVDFFSTDQIVDAVNRVLNHRTRMQGLREAARRTVIERYDLETVCLPQHVKLIEKVAGSPAATA